MTRSCWLVPGDESCSECTLDPSTEDQVRGLENVMKRPRLLVMCLALFLLTLWRYWIPYDPTDFVHRDPESQRLAYSIFEHGRFANPFVPLDTGPSAHLSPIFPGFLALLMKGFGTGSVGMYVEKMSAVLILGIELALLPLCGEILGMGVGTGILAALLWLLGMPRLLYGFENLYAAGLAMAACWLYRLFMDDRRRSWALGLVAGLAILLEPPLLLVFASWMVWELRHHRGARLLPLALFPCLVLLPWTMRNYMVFHRLVLLRDDLGLELAVSNNDCAKFGIKASMAAGCFSKMHPNDSLAEAARMRAMGEIPYNHARQEEAVAWIASHPSRFAKLTAERVVAFWLPTETFAFPRDYTSGRTWEREVIYCMTALSMPGLILMFHRDRQSAGALCSFLVFFPLIYYVVQFEYRYRYPILWITYLLGAFSLIQLGKRLTLLRRGKQKEARATQPMLVGA